MKLKLYILVGPTYILLMEIHNRSGRKQLEIFPRPAKYLLFCTRGLTKADHLSPRNKPGKSVKARTGLDLSLTLRISSQSGTMDLHSDGTGCPSQLLYIKRC